MTPPSALPERAAAEERTAVVAGVLCYFFWGFLPLLFKAAAWAGATPFEIVAWRATWSVPFALALVLIARQWPQVMAVARTPRTLAWLTLSALLVGCNWTIFVWAVGAGHTLDASLGYYLNPLMSVAAGMVLFKERIGKAGWTAIILAGIGVAVQTAAHGGLPVAALGMASTFCAYGVIRKRVRADAQTGLFIECAVLLIPAASYAFWLQSSGAGHFTHPMAGFLLFLGGPVTVAPLVTFAWAARRMPLSTLGFLQFIAPTMQFIIGVSFGERLSPLNILAFAFIWAGVAVYVVTVWRKTRRMGAAIT